MNYKEDCIKYVESLGYKVMYGKGCDGWGMRGLKTFKQDMRNSLKRIEKCLDFNCIYKTRN